MSFLGQLTYIPLMINQNDNPSYHYLPNPQTHFLVDRDVICGSQLSMNREILGCMSLLMFGPNTVYISCIFLVRVGLCLGDEEKSTSMESRQSLRMCSLLRNGLPCHLTGMPNKTDHISHYMVYWAVSSLASWVTFW